MSAVRLLPFAPPFRAALALANDLDDLADPRGWWEFLRFLNTREPTRFGEGLGLEVGDSFWFQSDDPEGQPGSYFRGLTDEPSPFAPLIARLGRSGHLDSMHSYGNFSRWGGFHRGHAERAARVLRDEGFRPTVWINHGGGHDFQNLWMGCGDLPENPEAEGAPAPEYHLDLTRSLGVRYAWIGEMTRLPGQDRPIGPGDWLHPGSPLRREVAAWGARSAARRLAYADVLGPYPNPLPLRNDLIRPRRMRDGTVLSTFIRCGDFRRAAFADLAWLLRPSFLDTLERVGGVSVVFVHWNRHPGRDYRDLDPAALAALRGLAARAREKRIRVTTTGRLLAWAQARRAVRIMDEGPGRVRIEAEPLPDGRVLPAEDLAGLAFRVPAGPPPSFRYRDRTIEVERCPGAPDAVWIPAPPLVFPDPPPGIA